MSEISDLLELARNLRPYIEEAANDRVALKLLLTGEDMAATT